MVDEPLQTVTETAERRERATADYHAAIIAARAHGHTLQAIGTAAGVTRNAIWKTLRRLEGEPIGYDWPPKPWK